MPFEGNGSKGLLQAESFLQVMYWIVNRQHSKREQGVSSIAMVLNITKKTHFICNLMETGFDSFMSVVYFLENSVTVNVLSWRFDSIKSFNKSGFRVSPSHQHSTTVLWQR